MEHCRLRPACLRRRISLSLCSFIPDIVASATISDCIYPDGLQLGLSNRGKRDATVLYLGFYRGDC
jgi:hypothetical protein